VLAAPGPVPVRSWFGLLGDALMNRDLDARHQARAWTLLLIACGIAWFALLGARPLYNPDEGRYAQIPAEMLASGDYTLPRLDGMVYLEKPPLQYWATALSLRVFGHTEWAARLVTAGSAVLALLFVYLLGRRLWSAERGLIAASMTGSMLLYVTMGQLTTLDMSLSCWLTIAIAAFCLGQAERERAPDRTRTWMLVCWAAMAAATLTKGLIGIVLPGAVLVLYTALQRDAAAWRHLHLGKGLALYVILVAPWCLAVERAHPGALDFLVIHEHFQRYLTKVHDRFKPWWYFLMILAAGSLPWLPQAARSLLLGWRPTAPRGRFDGPRVLWVSAAFTLFFFSLSDSKLAPYIVPVLAPLSLLAAGGGSAALKDLRLAAGLQLVLGVAIAIALPMYGQRTLGADATWTRAMLTPYAWMVAALLAGGGTLALRQSRSGLGRARRTLAAAGFAAPLLLLALGGSAIAGRYSVQPLLARVGPLEAGAPLYTVETFDWTLPFYADRPVVPVVYRGELDYGLKFEPSRGLDSVEAFEARWRDSPSGYALVPPATAARLARDGVPMRELGRDFDNVFVSRR
jgi:4-amino-4-deoxy-L-arabinose transferase-like glycosyltransferase